VDIGTAEVGSVSRAALSSPVQSSFQSSFQSPVLSVNMYIDLTDRLTDRKRRELPFIILLITVVHAILVSGHLPP